VSLLVALYLLLVVALPIAIGLALGYRALPRTERCPVCRGETLRLRSRLLRWISRALPSSTLHRRWCPACGWEGVARLRAARAAQGAGAGPPATTPALPDNTVDVRELEVDGQPWRIRLHCWAEADRWFGRLVFLAPSGRLWIDTREPLTGRTRREIVSKALALPDALLLDLLRELESG